MRRSNSPSGRAASPTVAERIEGDDAFWSDGGSARTGGLHGKSAMGGLRGEIGFDPVGEQQVVDAAVQRLELGRPDRRRSRDGAALSSALTRPGCGDSTRMRLPIRSASSIEWVTKITVKPTSLPQADQFLLHLAARQRVERGERLVHQQDLRLHRERARDRDALLHAAGQHVRIARSRIG